MYVYTYMYREILASYCCDLSRCISKFRVGDNSRTVNTSTSADNSDQLGTENAG